MLLTGKAMWRCNVLNCGNGQCVHEILDECCPFCHKKMILVKTNGVKFCSNHPSICDYEVDPSANFLTK
jgi:hypothetical protein